MQPITPQGLYSDPLSACTHGQRLGIRRIAIAQNLREDISRGRREERMSDFYVVSSRRKTCIYRGKVPVGGGQKSSKWRDNGWKSRMTIDCFR